MKFRCKYTYEPAFGYPKHVWTVIGRYGAIHFHVTDLGGANEYVDRRYSGGLEVHYRQPPDYMSHNAPQTEKCWLIGGPCWHDGTSLYAQEKVIPFWLCDPTDPERMFRFLEQEYETRLTQEIDE